jgi:hypothetical protein
MGFKTSTDRHRDKWIYIYISDPNIRHWFKYPPYTNIFQTPCMPCHAMPCMGRVPCHCCHSTIWHPPSTPNCLSFLSKVAFLEQCFFLSILWCSQNGNDPHEDLAKFGFKIHTKVKNLKHPSIFVATCLNQCIEIWWFFLIFDQILGIKNLKKDLKFNTFHF